MTLEVKNKLEVKLNRNISIFISYSHIKPNANLICENETRRQQPLHHTTPINICEKRFLHTKRPARAAMWKNSQKSINEIKKMENKKEKIKFSPVFSLCRNAKENSIARQQNSERSISTWQGSVLLYHKTAPTLYIASYIMYIVHAYVCH